MSRWFPDSLRIGFSPDRVVLEHQTVNLKLIGARSRVLQRQVLDTGSQPGRKNWDGALQVLATALEAYRHGYCAVSVILANSLVRYALVPQSHLLSAEQETAVLQHCFHEIYGSAAEQWELRLSAASGVPLQPATGVDRSLLDGLRALFSDSRLRLRSIQPRLMAVCNEHRAVMGGGPAWLLLVEPGNLCLGLIAGGGLARLRSLRSGKTWASDLPWLLEREACLAELDVAPGDVLLWHRDGAPPATLAAEPLRLHVLQDRLQDPLPVEAGADSEALALAGD